MDSSTGGYSLRPNRALLAVDSSSTAPPGFDLPGRFLIRDNDKIYGAYFRNRVDGLGLEQVRTAFRSPWQNGFAERWIGSLRRDCLDHIIAANERQLRRVIRSYVDYYHKDRTSRSESATLSHSAVPAAAGEVIRDCPLSRRTTSTGSLVSFRIER